MSSRYDFSLAASLTTDPSPSSPLFSNLGSRATDEVLDSLLSDKPVAVSYVLFRQRDHKELAVAVSVENKRHTGLISRRPPFSRVVHRGSLGQLCIKFDSTYGTWCLGRHGNRAEATKAYTHPSTGLSAMEEAEICGCATIAPWEKSWKFVLQFEGLEEGSRYGVPDVLFGDIFGEKGSILMKVASDGALRRVKDDDVPSALRFTWLSGRPAVILNDHEQKRLPRMLDLSDVNVMQCTVREGHIVEHKLKQRRASETSSGHPTPDQVLRSLEEISGSFVESRNLNSSSSSR